MMPSRFTLLHGAWHGAWCWEDVARILRERGHTVTTPTQTGLGEKADLLSADITLQTFVDDVVSHLVDNDLNDVILVGHSFGGGPITGAAAKVPERIRELVYLDALVPLSGVSQSERLPAETWAERKSAALNFSGGISIPCPPAEAFGILDAGQQSWVEARLTPHPTRTYETTICFDGPPGSGLPCRYIKATAPVFRSARASVELALSLGWPIQEIATGHDVMVSAPEALADLLEKTL